MRSGSGSILAIVLIVMTALYLLAGMMLVVNRQYFYDVEMLQDSVISRQKLLRVSRELLNDVDELLQEAELIEWDSCHLDSQPEYIWSEDQEVFYQIAKLSKYCSGDVVTVRLWLKDSDDYEGSLIVDYIVSIDGWRHTIEFDEIAGDVFIKNKSWMLSLDNRVFARKFMLIEGVEDFNLLKKEVRLLDNYLELVLVFENNIENTLRLYHLWIPIAELHFNEEMLFQYYVEKVVVEDKAKIVALNQNDQFNQNWWVEFSDSSFEDLVVKNNAVFLALTNAHDQKEKGVVGMYLSGLLFFGNADIGYVENKSDEVYELFDCTNGEKLMVAEKWQLGCDNHKKIRYYFAE